MVQETQPSPLVPPVFPHMYWCRDDERVCLALLLLWSNSVCRQIRFIYDEWATSCQILGDLLSLSLLTHCSMLKRLSVFNKPTGAKLGILSAIYSLGAIISLPVVPLIADGLGRRNAIIVGSVVMILGAALQTAATNCP